MTRAAAAPTVPYAELHTHSAFSFLDGANQPEELVAEAVRLGLEGLAITDHDGLHGVVRFSQAARAVGLPTVIGAELGLNATTATTGVPDPQSTHLLVLARDPEGYARLSRAIATAHLVTGQKGQRDYGRAVGLDPLEVLAEQSGGPGASHWLVLTGCRKGPLRRVLDPDGSGRRWDVPAARRELDRLVALFGRDNVAVELTDQARPTDGERNAVLVDLAHGAGVTAVVTGAVHAARPRDAPLADVLAAVRARSSLEDIDGWLPPHPAHLRSGAEMLARHAAHPEAVAAAARLAAECAFDLTLVAPNLPPYPVPEGHTEASWLRELTLRGAREKYGTREAPRHPDAWATIDKELDLITRLDFPGYFLIVGEIVDFCRREGILCQGRGSAANSAVCYSLGITAVDAVQHKLLFERFLSDGRTGPPDIDLDIESGRREEAIQFVYDRYGREFAAQVANVISYRARSAVRDSARAFGYDVGQQDAWSKGIERWGNLRGKGPAQPWWHGDPAVTGRPVPEAAAVPAPREKGVDSHDPLPPINGPATAQDLAEIPDHVLDMADQMLRLPRHLGIHSGGMVMCDRPVIEVCPVEWATMPGRTVLQWDKDDCADAGLVKFDLLGLGMLTALRLAFEHVAEVEGTHLALHSLPQEDPAVFELLQKADTVGVFQVESRAQIATLPRLKPVCFYDIVIEVALIRPGPIQGNSVHPFIRRKNGREPVVYLHEKLRPALEKTLGVPLFQEQLMQIAIDVASFTAAEADQLRRAMGSKRSQARMEALRGRLLEGMERNGIGQDVALQIYDKLRAFADFGFPESHAFSFAYLVYASTWLKAHHPEAFYAGLLGAQPMGFYSPSSLVADARRHGILVRRACVATSRVHAHVERTDGVVTVPTPAGSAPVVTVPTGTDPTAAGDPVDGPPPGVRGLRPRPTFARETWLEDRTRLEATDPGTATWDSEDDDTAVGGTAVDDTAVDGTAVDDTAVGGTAVDDTAVDGTAAAAADAAGTSSGTGARPRRAYAVRLGLAPIRGIGERTAERIVAARAERAFTDAADLARRARLTPAQIEALATAGALQVFGGSRRQALWAAGALAGEAGKVHVTSGGTWVQEVLVGTTVGTQAPVLPEMGAVEIAVADVWASGVSPEHHPTHFVRPRLRKQGVRPVSSLVAVEDGVRVEVGGVVTHRQRPGTAQGVTFLALEDETGMLNIVCSAGLWARHRRTAVRSRALVVRGTIERTDGVVNLLADGMRPLSLAVATSSRDFQ